MMMQDTLTIGAGSTLVGPMMQDALTIGAGCSTGPLFVVDGAITMNSEIVTAYCGGCAKHLQVVFPVAFHLPFLRRPSLHSYRSCFARGLVGDMWAAKLEIHEDSSCVVFAE
jgi:hypothetical protein